MEQIVIRTVIVYFLLLFSIRVMGKRQIGEMQTSEFIITILLSEIAASPVTNRNQSLLHALVPVVVLVALELLVSCLLLRSNLLKRLFYGSPAILIAGGVIDQREMRRQRVEIDELISELRQAGIADPRDVSYAVLEENGKLSVFERAGSPSPSDAGGSSSSGGAPGTNSGGGGQKERGIAHVCVIDGTVVEKNLARVSWDKKRLEKELAARSLSLAEVYLLTVDDAGSVFCVKKEA